MLSLVQLRGWSLRPLCPVTHATRAKTAHRARSRAAWLQPYVDLTVCGAYAVEEPFATTPRSDSPLQPHREEDPRERVQTVGDQVRDKLRQGDVDGAIRLVFATDAAEYSHTSRTYRAVLAALRDAERYDDVFDLFDLMKTKRGAMTEGSYTTVINTCARVRDAARAEQYLEELKKADGLEINVFNYSAVLDACVKGGRLDKAISYFEEMKASGIQPSCAAYSSLLAGLHHMRQKEKAVEMCTALLVEMQEDFKLRPNGVVYAAAMSVYSAAGDSGKVIALYSLMKHRGTKMDVVIYNYLFKFFSNSPADLKHTLRFYGDMLERRIEPVAFTFTLLLRAAANAGDVQQAERFLRDLEHFGFQPTVLTYNMLMLSYIEAVRMGKDIPDAMAQCERVLERLCTLGLEPDDVTFNQLMLLCYELGDLARGVQFFQQMQAEGIQPTVISYTILIKLNVQLGNASDGMLYLEPCFQILKEMERLEMALDERVFATLFQACSRARHTDMLPVLMAKMQERKIRPNRYVYNCIIQTWASVHGVEEALEVFDTMMENGIRPNVVSFAILFRGLVEQNAVPKILEKLSLMEKLGVEPNETLQRVLAKLDSANLRHHERNYVMGFMR